MLGTVLAAGGKLVSRSSTFTQLGAVVSKCESLKVPIGRKLSLSMLFLFIHKLCNVLLIMYIMKYVRYKMDIQNKIIRMR